MTASCGSPIAHSKRQLIDGEAIQKPISAGAAQIGLAAAAIGPLGGMRRIPRPRRIVGGSVGVWTPPIEMANHRRALGAACPVLAGAILGAGERGPVPLRTCEHVVPVGCVAEAVDAVALLAQRRLLVKIFVP